MSLLSYEGVEVKLPTDLTGISFNFAAGALTINCRDFTGDIVLVKRNVSSSGQFITSSTSKKRVSGLSDKNDDEARAKRLRPDEAEQALLLARLNGSVSSNSYENERNGGLIKEVHGEGDTQASKTHKQSVDFANEKEMAMKKTRKEAHDTKKSAEFSFSPDRNQSTSRKTTPNSSQKRNKTPKSRLEISSSTSIKKLINGLPQPAPEAAIKWEIMKSAGHAPSERWGHSTTKISEERIVIYGGTDDDERTLGDLHVFDMNTQHWTTPLNCETITRTWHDAVFLSSKNLLLVFGGERNSAAEGEVDILSDIMVLDTECFLWYPPPFRGSPPSARSGHSCTAIGNEVVVFGGSGGRNRQGSVHILDSGDWTWKTVKVEGKAPKACTYHSAVAVGDDKIVYFGGNDSSKSFNEVHVLQKLEKNDSDAVWRWFHPCTVGVPPQERTGHSATLLHDGKILIFGGWDPQRDDSNAPTSVFDDSFLLDTKSWEWQPAILTDEGRVETAVKGRVGHGAVIHSNGRVHVFGGQDGAEHRLNDICTMTILQS